MHLKHGRPGRMYQDPRTGQKVVIERIDPEDRVFFRTKTHTDGPEQSGLSELFPMSDWKYVGIGREAGHCVCGLPLKDSGDELRCTSPEAIPGGSRTLLHSTFSNPRRHPTASPWGPIGHVEHLGYGVEAVSTATHGAYGCLLKPVTVCPRTWPRRSTTGQAGRRRTARPRLRRRFWGSAARRRCWRR